MRKFFDDTRLTRLRRAREASYRRLQPFRQNRMDAIRQYVGRYYSDDGPPRDVPVNEIEQLVTIFASALVARNPKALVLTRIKDLRPLAGTFEISLNERIAQMRLRDELEMCVTDAIFCMGIMKVGVAMGENDASDLFAMHVDMDDWVHDMDARRWGDCTFMGNRYRLPIDTIRESDLYNKHAKDVMTNDSETDENGDERATGIGSGSELYDDSFYEFGELWDLWLPREKLLVTLADRGTEQPLRVVEWDGPKPGPYRRLGLREVLGNTMPLSLVATMRPLHNVMNAVFRKLSDQAERQKTITLVRDTNIDDGERVRAASDGEVVKTNNPDAVKEMKYGGPDPANQGFALMIRDWFSYFAGNLDSVGGLGQQGDTLGQEELIARGASGRPREMQQKVVEFAKDVVGDLAWYVWNDPQRTDFVMKGLPGMKEKVTARFGPEERRQARYDMFDFDIEPYSMQHTTPQARLAGINGIMQTILPLLPMMQQQGMGVDVQALLKILTRYSDLSEMDDIIRYAEPVQQDQAQARSPAFSHRTYERVNRPTKTRAGQEGEMAKQLMAAAQNEG